MWLNIEYKYTLCCVYSQLLNHDYGTTEQQKYVWFRQPDKCANQPKNIISILHPKKIWASSTTIRNCYKCLKWAEPSNIECFVCVCTIWTRRSQFIYYTDVFHFQYHSTGDTNKKKLSSILQMLRVASISYLCRKWVVIAIECQL